jgi:hypothetical protein
MENLLKNHFLPSRSTAALPARRLNGKSLFARSLFDP